MSAQYIALMQCMSLVHH